MFANKTIDDFVCNFIFCRWLVSQGQVDKAIKIMKKFERINGTQVSEKMYTEFSVSIIIYYGFKGSFLSLLFYIF